MNQFLTYYPIPTVVLRNIRELESAVPKKGRIILHPANHLTDCLLQQGYLAHFQIIGTLPFDEQKPHFFIKASISNTDLGHVEVEALLAVDPCFPNSPSPTASSIGARLNIPVYNLCAGYDNNAYRAELVRAVDQLSFQEKKLPITDIEVCMPKWGLGDMICALTAARALARQNPNLKVHFNRIPAIMRAFKDTLVTPGSGVVLNIGRPDAHYFFWDQNKCISYNYVDNYFLSLGLNTERPPRVELPKLPPFEELQNIKYIVLQPRASGIHAHPHLKITTLQRIIDDCPFPVILAGSPGSNMGLRGINCSFAKDELNICRLIQHAALVLSPRSASAHIAAGYGIPSVIWLPDDHLNWHLDYPDWRVRKIPATDADIELKVRNASLELLGLSGLQPSMKKHAAALTLVLFFLWLIKTYMDKFERHLLLFAIRICPGHLRKLLKKTFIYDITKNLLRK